MCCIRSEQPCPKANATLFRLFPMEGQPPCYLQAHSQHGTDRCWSSLCGQAQGLTYVSKFLAAMSMPVGAETLTALREQQACIKGRSRSISSGSMRSKRICCCYQ